MHPILEITYYASYSGKKGRIIMLLTRRLYQCQMYDLVIAFGIKHIISLLGLSDGWLFLAVNLMTSGIN